MKTTHILNLTILCFFIYTLPAFSQSTIYPDKNDTRNEIPAQTGWVNDFEQLLDKEEVFTLSEQLQKFDKKTDIEVLMVTLPNYGSYEDMMQYSNALIEEWNYGKSEKHHVILLMSAANKNIRIWSNGNISKVLNEERCNDIIKYYMMPELAEDLYYQGLLEGVKGIFEALDYKSD